jgi:hypothetical protein
MKRKPIQAEMFIYISYKLVLYYIKYRISNITAIGERTDLI